MNSDVNAMMMPLVMTPSLEMMLSMGSQMPMSWAFLGNGRLSCVSTLNASMRISNRLFMRAKSGPSGKATTNSVMKPY